MGGSTDRRPCRGGASVWSLRAREHPYPSLATYHYLIERPAGESAVDESVRDSLPVQVPLPSKKCSEQRARHVAVVPGNGDIIVISAVGGGPGRKAPHMLKQ